MNTIFLGNETAYLGVLHEAMTIECIVCTAVSEEAERHFGSSLLFAKKHDIPTLGPEEFLTNPPAADLLVSAGFGRRIPRDVLDQARVAAINIHPSLLPAYRGRHPLNWAIIHGEDVTGVTIHHMNERFDDGHIIAQARVAIGDDDTIMDVFRKSVRAGEESLRHLLDAFNTRGFVGSPAFIGMPQDTDKASSHPPRTPEDGRIAWRNSAESIRNLVRALTPPYPGAFFVDDASPAGRIVVDAVEFIEDSTPAMPVGSFAPDGRMVRVQTGTGSLRITKFRDADGECFRQRLTGRP